MNWLRALWDYLAKPDTFDVELEGTQPIPQDLRVPSEHTGKRMLGEVPDQPQ